MARTTSRPHPTATQTLPPLVRHCPPCGKALWAASHTYWPSPTLRDVRRLPLQIRRGITPPCPQFQQPYRPAAAGRLALPKPAFGLEIIPGGGPLRHAQPRSVPESQPALAPRRIVIAPRPVLHLLERADALVALSLAAPRRLQPVTQGHGRGSVAREGLPPAVGPAVLWGWRDGRSSAGLRARRLLSAPQEDVAGRLHDGKRCGAPLSGASPTGRLPAAVRGQRPCHRCPPSGGTATPGAQRPRPSLRPTARPSKSGTSTVAVGAPGNARVTSARPLQPQSSAAMAVRCAGRSPTRVPHPWPPRAARATPGAPRSPRVWSRAQTGGRASAAGPAPDAAPPGLHRDRRAVARGAGPFPLGPSGGPRPRPRSTRHGGSRQASPGRPAGRHDPPPSGGRGTRPRPGTLPERLAPLLARALARR
jgi:hypothetical protein